MAAGPGGSGQALHRVCRCVGKAANLALIGVAAGMVAAVALSRVVQGMLYGITARDPVAFATVIALTVVVVLWRATCRLGGL